MAASVFQNNINLKSISCNDIPELFLDKIVAKNHFGKFGKINKFILRPNRLQCTVDFENEDDAKMALIHGGTYNGHEFTIKYTENEISHIRNTEEWVDPDIQSELEAMGGGNSIGQKQSRAPLLSNSSLYSLKSPQPLSTRILKPILKHLKSPSSQQAQTFSTNENIGITQKSVEMTAQNLALKSELENIMRKPALSAAEKYTVLDARDKYLRLITIKTTDIKKAVSTKGTCPDMCPEKERLLRETRDQISSFELSSDGSSMNHKKAVKEYSRSSADQEVPLAHELRPESVLKMTMTYLLHQIMNLCDDEDTNIGDWFHFVWDRTRSIRKDITQQELCSVGVVDLIEQCARFHIHCAARLIAEDPSVFDQKINTENLTKCLQSLKYMYHDLRIKNIKCPNEAEFRGYVILLNLNDANFLWELKQLPEEIQDSKEVTEAINFYHVIENNNFVKFFKMVRKTTYLNSCILMRYFNQIRNSAMRTIIKAYIGPRQNTIQMPLTYLTNILAFESTEHAAVFFDHYGFECDDERVVFEKNWNYIPDMPLQLGRYIQLVESKKKTSVGEVICGKQLPSISTFENHKLQNSFDRNGILKQSAWTAENQNDFNTNSTVQDVRKSMTPPGDGVFKVPNRTPPVLSKQQQQNQQIKPTAIFVPNKPFQSLLVGKVNVEKANKTSEPIFNSNKLSPITTTTPFFGISKTSFDAHNASKGDYYQEVADEPKPTILSQPSDQVLPSRSLFGDQASNIGISSKKPLESPLSVFSIPKSNSTSILGANTTPVQFQDNIFSSPKSSNANQVNTVPPSQITTNISSAAPKSSFSNSFQKADKQDKQMDLVAKTSDSLSKSLRKRSLSTEYFETIDAAVINSEKIFEKIVAPHADTKILEEEKQKEQESQKKAQEELEEIIKLKKSLMEKNSKRILNEILEEFCTEQIEEIAVKSIDEVKRRQVISESADQLFVNISNETVTEIIKEIGDNELRKNFHNQNILSKFFQKWRLITAKSLERRNLIQRARDWVVPESYKIVANQIAHPTRNLNLEMMQRYRLGISKQFNLQTASDVQKINVFKILSNEIGCDNMNFQIYGRLKSRKYLKFVISLPNENDEIKNFSSFITSFLDEAIDRQKPQNPNKGFLCESYSNFAVCIQCVNGIQSSRSPQKTCRCNNANGLIFFFTLADLASTHSRLYYLINNSNIKKNIPLALLMYKTTSIQISDTNIEEYLALNRLKELNKIKDYKILETTDSTLYNQLQNSLIFITKNLQFTNELEMQNSVSFLQATIADEIWIRFLDSWRINPSFQIYCNRPENVVTLYNMAINRLLALFEENLNNYPEFPVELLEFVPNFLDDIPKDLEYFPKDWKNPNRNIKICQFLKKLRLKSINNNWLELELPELEKEILNYSKKCITTQQTVQTSGYAAIKALLEHLNVIELNHLPIKDRLERISWLQIIRPITLELLAQIWKTNNSQIPNEFIYVKDKFQEYSKYPWWLEELKKADFKFENEKILSSFTSNTSIDDDMSGQNVDPENDNCLDDIINKSYNIIEKANENIERYNDDLNITREISKNLDMKIYEIESKKLKSQILKRSDPNENNLLQNSKKFKYNNIENNLSPEKQEIQDVIMKAMSIINKVECHMDK